VGPVAIEQNGAGAADGPEQATRVAGPRNWLGRQNTARPEWLSAGGVWTSAGAWAGRGPAERSGGAYIMAKIRVPGAM